MIKKNKKEIRNLESLKFDFAGIWTHSLLISYEVKLNPWPLRHTATD